MTDNPQIELAYNVIANTNTSLFLTGKAGTGKTTFLRRLRKVLPKRMVVLAPTGIAAINAQGVTIHSFFQLAFGPFVPGTHISGKGSYKMTKQKLQIIQSIDLLVIDEISMVRADLLDSIDDALKRYRGNALPFGGVQLLLIGDLQQLAPVAKENEWAMLQNYYKTPYFFSSKALQQTNYVTIELQTVYRQTDSKFLDLLNSVRNCETDDAVLSELNKRYFPNFKTDKDGFVQLVTHNWQAQNINSHKLEELPGKPFIHEATIEGKFSELTFPTEQSLKLKVGAQVMFVKNDPGKKYFNGMIGSIVKYSKEHIVVQPHDQSLSRIEVHPDKWENTRYGIDEETKEIKEFVDGSFTQYPLKLAWAITIHKSQGLTFDKVLIDASRSFAHGQTYVALSRCRTLEGIVLTSPIPPSAIVSDSSLDHYNAEMKGRAVDDAKLEQLRNDYSVYLLDCLFSFNKELKYFSALNRIFQEHLYKLYATTAAEYEVQLNQFTANVVTVSSTFHKQYKQMLIESQGNVEDPQLQQRITKGTTYFEEQLTNLRTFVRSYSVEADNAAVNTRMKAAFDLLYKQLCLHIQLLHFVSENGFQPKVYLNERAKCILETLGASSSKSKKKKGERLNKQESIEAKKYALPSEVKNSALFFRLQAWRREKAQQLNTPSSSVLSSKALISIANYAPTDLTTLKKMPYFGAKSAEKYGSEILSMVHTFINDKNNGTIEIQEPLKVYENQSLSTFAISLQLYKKGNTINEIAEKRGLSHTTIYNHLTRFIESGEVNFNDLVAPEHFERIKHYYDGHRHSINKTDLTTIRNDIGNDISYNELRFAIDTLKKKQRKQVDSLFIQR